MLSRRALVGKFAAGAAVALAAGVGRASNAFARGETNTPTGGGHGEGHLARVPEGPGGPKGPEATDASPPAPLSGPPPWDLLHPLAMGSVVAHGWRLAELTGVTDGACVLTLRNERDRAHRVHLCRNDGRPQGIVYTERFDLVVMNGGQGDLPTEEGLAQAVAEVAHVLAANEGNRPPELAVALLPHAERLRLFSAPADGRLR